MKGGESEMATLVLLFFGADSDNISLSADIQQYTVGYDFYINQKYFFTISVFLISNSLFFCSSAFKISQVLWSLDSCLSNLKWVFKGIVHPNHLDELSL